LSKTDALWAAATLGDPKTASLFGCHNACMHVDFNNKYPSDAAQLTSVTEAALKFDTESMSGDPGAGGQIASCTALMTLSMVQ